MSIIWANQKCYVKCTKHENEADKLCQNKDWPLINGFRYCPKDGNACQIQCWTSRKFGNIEVPLIGEKNLKKYNVTADQILRASYENYKRNGNVDPKQDIDGVLNTVNNPNNDDTLLRLPVCRNDYNISMFLS